MNHFWLVGFRDRAKDPIPHCLLGGEGVGWWAFVWIILTSIQCFTCFMDLSGVFVLHCGISRDKQRFSGDLSVLIHVTVVIPAAFCSLLWLLYSTSHNTGLCGPAPVRINTKERKCFVLFFHATWSCCAAGDTATHNPAKPSFTNIQKGTGDAYKQKQLWTRLLQERKIINTSDFQSSEQLLPVVDHVEGRLSPLQPVWIFDHPSTAPEASHLQSDSRLHLPHLCSHAARWL